MNERPKPRWIKLYTDMFDNWKIQLILAMPGGLEMVYLWTRLLCQAGKLNNGGVFEMEDGIVITEDIMAAIFRLPPDTVKHALEVFENLGMIKRDKGVIMIPDWEEHQSLNQMLDRREYNREYMRKRRQREREAAAEKETALCEDGVSGVNVDNAYSKQAVNTVEENRTEDKREEEKRTDRKDAFAELAGDDTELLCALKDFERMRSALKKPLTPKARELICRKLEPYGPAERVRMLEESISHCWVDVYELSEPPGRRGAKGKKEPSPESEAKLIAEMNALMSGSRLAAAAP